MKNIIQPDNDNQDKSHYPNFLRLPKPGTRCKWTGLSRSGMNTLVLPSKENNYKPVVRSYLMKKRGYMRGIRFIDFDSLVMYIKSFGNGYENPVLV